LADIWVNILGDGSKLKGELDKSSKNVSSFSEKIGKIGKIATAGGLLVTAAFAKIVTGAAKVGDQFDKMSLRTGVSVEDLSALAYAADISGTDIATLEKGLKGLTKVLDDASMGIGEGMEAFEYLDIAVVDTEGNLRSTVDVLKEAATKISAIEDPTKQAALAMDLFGSRAGPQLLPLLKEGEGGIEELMNKAKELGITMSTEAATKAAEFTDRMTDLKGSLAGAGRTIGDTLIPAIIPLIERVTEIVGKVSTWAKENPELIETIITLGAKIGVIAAVGGPVLMAVSAFSKMSGGLKLIGTILTPPAGFVVAAIAGIVLIWKNWDTIVEFVSGFVDKIMGFLTDLRDKAIGKVQDMIDRVLGIFDKIRGLIDKVKGWGKSISEALGNGMSAGNPRVEKAMDEVVETVAKPIRSRSPIQYGPLKDLHKWGMNIPGEFGRGIIDGLDLVYEPVEKLTSGILDIFENLKIDLKSNIVDPIVGYLETNLANAISGILSGADELEWNWTTFWEGLKNVLINAVAAMIAKLIILASFSWLFGLLGWPLALLGLEKGGGVGYDLGGQVKKFQFGGVADTIPARLTVGEYVIAKPMTDFIKKFKAIPQNLVDAVIRGLPTPIPAFAGGGPVSTSNIVSTGFGETKIYVDIHDNKISDDVDIKRLAITVSGEILRKINQNRRY
jgi:TP901 family phage tail tape measure protein